MYRRKKYLSMVIGTVEQQVIGGQAKVQATAEAVLENQREIMHLEHTKNATREALASIRRKEDKSARSWYVLGQESMLLLHKGAVEDHLKAEQREQEKATEQLRFEQKEKLDALYKLDPNLQKIPTPAAELLLRHKKPVDKNSEDKKSETKQASNSSKSAEKKADDKTVSNDKKSEEKQQKKPDRLDYSRWDKMDFSDSDLSDDLVDDGSDVCSESEFIDEDELLRCNDLRELVKNSKAK